MAAPTQGTIAAAEKIAELVKKAPAGGIFTDAIVEPVAGIEVEGFGGFAGFAIRIESPHVIEQGHVYEVAVQRVR